jgi:hypothetical protein
MDVKSKALDRLLVPESTRSDGRTYTIRIYDKKKEMMDKKEAIASRELMRLEYVLNKSSAIKDNFKTSMLNEINDVDIEDYFYRKTKKLFNKMDKYLNDKLQYKYISFPPGCADTVANMLCRRREINLINAYAILADISHYTESYGVPCLLDLEDCFYAYQNLVELHYLKAEEEESFRKLLHQAYDDINKSNALRGQRILYTEIYTKFLDRSYRVTIELNN